MGFFSWKCAVSGESISNVYSGRDEEKSKCYLITPDKTYYEDAYEGYGIFGGVDVYELLGDGDRLKGIEDRFTDGKTPKFKIKLVLKEHFDNQSYEDLPESEDCEQQGFFYIEEESE